MGNAISAGQLLLHPQNSEPQQQHQDTPPPKPLKAKPDLSEPAFEGYVAGWRRGDFDDDATEFSFATFQDTNHTSTHDPNVSFSGYEGDDEEEQSSGVLQQKTFRHEDAVKRLQRDEFEALGRGRAESRGKEKETTMGIVRKPSPSMERKLVRVRQTVAERPRRQQQQEVLAR